MQTFIECVPRCYRFGSSRTRRSCRLGEAVGPMVADGRSGLQRPWILRRGVSLVCAALAASRFETGCHAAAACLLEIRLPVGARPTRAASRPSLHARRVGSRSHRRRRWGCGPGAMRACEASPRFRRSRSVRPGREIEFLERGLLGFYLAVAEEGEVVAGDPIVELERDLRRFGVTE